jgi:hypothetical protein
MRHRRLLPLPLLVLLVLPQRSLHEPATHRPPLQQVPCKDCAITLSSMRCGD